MSESARHRTVTPKINEARKSLHKAYYHKKDISDTDVSSNIFIWSGFFGIVIFFMWTWSQNKRSPFTTDNVVIALLMSFLALLVWNTSKNNNIDWTYTVHLMIFFLGAIGVLVMCKNYIEPDEDKNKGKDQ